MKRLFVFILTFFLFSFKINFKEDKPVEEIIKKSISAIEKVNSISYTEFYSSSAPFDTANIINSYYVKSIAVKNPSDSINLFSKVQMFKDTNQISNIYDFNYNVALDHSDKIATIKDYSKYPEKRNGFNFSPLIVSSQSLFKFALAENEVEISLAEENDKQWIIDFYFPNNRFEFWGTQVIKQGRPGHSSSLFTVSINKVDLLPVKVHRKQIHNVTISELMNYEINKHEDLEVNAIRMIPQDFEIYDKSVKRKDDIELLNNPAPNFSLLTVNGKKVELNDFKERLVLLEFTSIGCGPCHFIIPRLKAIKEKYENSLFDIISVEAYMTKANQQAIQRYLDKNEINYDFIIGNKNIVEEYDVRGVPYFILIDRNGEIIELAFGTKQFDVIEAKIEEIMN